MRALALTLSMLLVSCALPAPLADMVIPTDTPVVPLLTDAGRQCSAVLVGDHHALTAAHCMRDATKAILLTNLGPVPVAGMSQPIPELDAMVLETTSTIPPPYAHLALEVPQLGALAHLQGYGCERASPAVPRFYTTTLVFRGTEPKPPHDYIFSGVACHGDSGGGIFNEDGELIAITSAIDGRGAPIVFGVGVLAPASEPVPESPSPDPDNVGQRP